MFKPYSYKKEIITPNARVIEWNLKSFHAKTVISLVLVSVGIFVMLTKVLIPVVSIYANTDDYAPIVSPVPEKDSSNLSVKENTEHFTFTELSEEMVPEGYERKNGILSPISEVNEKKDEDYFYLSIPSLDITDAKVEANSTNLDPRESLGHYNGTCLPNEACNAFIFGHSTFRGTKNRYENGDYSSIFSRLDELEYGDEFSIKYKDKTYRYIVDMTRVDDPENVNPLEDPYPNSIGKYESTVQLFTCTPPGTTLYRLSVIGKLVE